MKETKTATGFDFKALEATWNTFDQNDGGRRIPWGQPSHELCQYADNLGRWIFESNPWGYLYNYFGELPWEHNLWDIMDQEELVDRVICVLKAEIDDKMPESDKKPLCKFLNCIEYVQEEN